MQPLSAVSRITCGLTVAAFCGPFIYFVHLVWSEIGVMWGLAAIWAIPLTPIAVPIRWAVHGQYLPLELMGFWLTLFALAVMVSKRFGPDRVLARYR